MKTVATPPVESAPAGAKATGRHLPAPPPRHDRPPWRPVKPVSSPTLRQAIKSALHPLRDEKVDRLARQPLLASCSRAELRRLAKVADEVEIGAGNTLVQEGWIGYWFFMIDSGVADVTSRGRPIAQLGFGEFFGDITILGMGPQPATIRAATDMTLFVIGRREFLPLVDDLKGFQRGLFVSMTRQLKAAGELQWKQLALANRHRLRPRTVAASAATTVDEPLEVLVAALIKPPPIEVLPVTRTRLSWRVRALLISAAAITIAGVALLYHPPVVVVTPGHTFDAATDIVIEGRPVGPVNGRYMVTPVEAKRRNLLGVALAMIDPDDEVVRIRATPWGSDPAATSREARDQYRRSQRAAAAAAARAVGLPVVLKGTGARVVGVADGSAAEGLLEVDDVVVAVDGRPVRLATDLFIPSNGSRRPRFELTVDRYGQTLTVVVTSPPVATNPPASGSPMTGPRAGPWLGLSVETRDADFDLPFDVRFRQRHIGGPSAGLVYALALVDLLDTADIARGRTVAATGAIALDGAVGNVGQIAKKAAAARAAGAEVFLLPAGQQAEDYERWLDARGVATLAEALALLRAA
jgi:PDZ domain-containing protein